MERRFPESSLPVALAHNPHLRFQFEHIIKQRWLWYAAQIRAGRRIAAETPLDFFIHSDTSTAEGAILSEFYRRQGTPILVAPHSAWPCDATWTVRQKSDPVSFRAGRPRAS